MKRSICALMALALMISFSSCGESNNENNKTEQTAQKLTLWGSSDDQTMLGEMIDSFRAEHSDVQNEIEKKVTGEDKAAPEALKDIEAAADVFAIGHDQLGSLVSAGAIYEIGGEYKEKVMSDCSDASIKAATLNDKLYGFPSSAETYMLYYDKSKLSDSDVNSLTTILNKSMGDGVYKFGMNFKEGYYGTSLFFTAGCTLYGKNGDDASQCDFNSDNGVNAAKIIKSLSSQGVVNCDENEALAQIKAGKLASYVTGPWKSDAMKEALGDNYGVAKLPTVNINGEEKQMMSFGGYKIYVVNAKTKDPAAAMKLAQHLTSQNNQVKRFKDRGLLPVNKIAADSSDIMADKTVSATMHQLEYAVPMPSINQISKYWTAFSSFADDCFNGNIKDDDLKSKLDSLVDQVTEK